MILIDGARVICDPVAPAPLELQRVKTAGWHGNLQYHPRRGKGASAAPYLIVNKLYPSLACWVPMIPPL